ncbi:hypothetical protein ACRZPZ_004526 [Salmonella enterica subsp. diarizonae serovar 61:k:1,5,(7)]
MLGGADNPNGELPSYITGADMPWKINILTACAMVAVGQFAAG